MNINKRAQSSRRSVDFIGSSRAFQLPFLLLGRLLRPAARLHVPEVLVYRFVRLARLEGPPSRRKCSHLAGFSLCLWLLRWTFSSVRSVVTRDDV